MTESKKCPLCFIWRFISTNLADSLCPQCRRRLLRYKDPIIAYLLLELKFVKVKINQISKLTGLAIGDKAIAKKIKEELYASLETKQKGTELTLQGKINDAEGKDKGGGNEKGESKQ